MISSALRIRRCWAVCLLLSITLATVLASNEGRAAKKKPAASSKNLSQKQKDLRKLRGKLEALRKEVASSEAKRADVSQRLRTAERKISGLQRDLRELSQKRALLQGNLRGIQREASLMNKRLSSQQRQLGQLIHRQYTQGEFDTLQLMLNGNDPAQMARDLVYLQAIARARSQLLEDIEKTLQRKRALAKRVGKQEASIAIVELRQKKQASALESQRVERKEALKEISSNIKSNRRKIGALERDEKTLTRLINKINKLIAERAARARRAAEKRKRERELARKRGKKLPKQLSKLPKPMAFGGSFVRLKGKMGAPTQGRITGRFGTRRREGSNWKGIFIRAKQGAPVRAVARGQVVFADWMRGFGNLLIIDHSGGYLTVYANNDGVLRREGDEVRGGDIIAKVGNSGGNPQFGLYFEIRYRGKVQNPLRWIRWR